MKCAEFETLLDAAIYRKNHGGWLFVSDRLEAFWFDAGVYTPEKIMRHRLTKNQSGRLVCDNQFIK